MGEVWYMYSEMLLTLEGRKMNERIEMMHRDR